MKVTLSYLPDNQNDHFLANYLLENGNRDMAEKFLVYNEREGSILTLYPQN